MLRIEPIPCLRDNYAYAIVDEAKAQVAIVDPSELGPIEAYLECRGLELVLMLATHHHADHVGGAAGLGARFGLDVVAHTVDAARLRSLGLRTTARADGDRLACFSAEVEVLHVPGHTLGAACFVLRESGVLPRLFTGDTLFLGGAGRVFEGNPAMLRASLERIAAIAPEALVYCGHEYTAANLQFSVRVEPDNTRARDALAKARGEATTVPGRLSVERESNPFLRAAGGHRFVVDGVGLGGSADAIFTALRAAKDVFKPEALPAKG